MHANHKRRESACVRACMHGADLAVRGARHDRLIVAARQQARLEDVVGVARLPTQPPGPCRGRLRGVGVGAAERQTANGWDACRLLWLSPSQPGDHPSPTGWRCEAAVMGLAYMHD